MKYYSRERSPKVLWIRGERVFDFRKTPEELKEPRAEFKNSLNISNATRFCSPSSNILFSTGHNSAMDQNYFKNEPHIKESTILWRRGILCVCGLTEGL